MPTNFFRIDKKNLNFLSNIIDLMFFLIFFHF